MSRWKAEAENEMRGARVSGSDTTYVCAVRDRRSVAQLRINGTARADEACRKCAVEELCFANGLTSADLARIDRIIDRAMAVEQDEHLFRVGDDFKALYAVRSGCFKTYTVDGAGREQVLGFYLTGDLLGLDAIFPESYRCNAMALHPSSVCALRCRDITGLAARVPALQAQIFRLMSKEISNARALSGQHSAEERLAAFLLCLSERFERRGRRRREVVLSMGRRDIANYLRLATETVSRVFARFQKNGLIGVDRREICLLDMGRLARIAESIRLY